MKRCFFLALSVLFVSFLAQSVYAFPLLMQSNKMEIVDWLRQSKRHFPLISYIPDFSRLEYFYGVKKRLQFDMQGDLKHSQNNFTDLTDSYNSEDGWVELKISLWLDDKKTFSPFLSLVPTFTTYTGRNFWWQNNNQINTGIQWYPFHGETKNPFLRSMRFFAQYSSRDYYDSPNSATANPGDLLPEELEIIAKLGQQPKQYDVQVGFDYYYDDIFSGNPVAFSIWSSLAWYKTNFTIVNPLGNRSKEYNAIISKGDVKYGMVKKWKDGIVYPYVTSQWTYSPSHEELFFENYLRMGVGVRYYPWVHASQKAGSSFEEGIMKRFNFFGEYLYNAFWLGDRPGGNVKDADVRFGFSFSTSGFFRDNNQLVPEPLTIKDEEKRQPMQLSVSDKIGVK